MSSLFLKEGYSLDRNSQKRILKQAKELATKQVNAEKQKSRIIKKDQIKREQQKAKKAKNKIGESKKATFLNSSNDIAEKYDKEVVLPGMEPTGHYWFGLGMFLQDMGMRQYT